MEERLEAVHSVRAALERGDLDGARVAALAVAVHPFVTPPAGRSADEAPERARDVATAPDLAAATSAFGSLLVACGDCHEAAGARIPDLEPVAPSLGDLEARMQRH